MAVGGGTGMEVGSLDDDSGLEDLWILQGLCTVDGSRGRAGNSAI